MTIDLPGIENLDVQNKKVIIRVDFNVPVESQNGETKVADTSRMEKTLPTLEHLLRKGASLIIISHLGRPESPGEAEYSLKPVCAELAKMLPNAKVDFAPFETPQKTLNAWAEKAASLEKGGVLLLDNIRYFKDETSKEKKDRATLARRLADMGHIYVNDAFGASHRAHASVYDIAALLPSYSGLLLKKEISILSGVLSSPKRPFVAVVGGAKVSSKMAVLNNLIKKVDHILIGGAMAYTFLKAKGLKVGSSLVENDLLSQAFQINDKANYNECGFFLPDDHVIASEYSERAKTTNCGLEIPEGWMGMDIGPKTIKKYERIIKDAATVLWNGPMGVFEMEHFDKGTMSIAKSMSKNGGFTLVGGGDSMAALRKSGLEDKISHISTGGGATLEFLEGKKLPGVEALIPKD